MVSGVHQITYYTSIPMTKAEKFSQRILFLVVLYVDWIRPSQSYIAIYYLYSHIPTHNLTVAALEGSGKCILIFQNLLQFAVNRVHTM